MMGGTGIGKDSLEEGRSGLIRGTNMEFSWERSGKT
jgi:hypothetical protein